MKPISNSFLLFCFTISFIFCAGNSFSQVVWQENFNANPCATGCSVNGYTGTNGAWTQKNATAEGADANVWYVSCAENGNTSGTCGTQCSGVGGDNTLHIGNVLTSIAAEFFCPDGDCGANYDTGAGDGTLTTDKRAISPVINLSGKSNLTLSFQYIEGGQGSTDNLSVDFSSDGGTTWIPLADPPKTNNSGCPGVPTGLLGGDLVKGHWALITPIPLPASANNNPNVKIAFHWKNNDDGAGVDPSAAVDNIVISVTSSTPKVNADFTVTSKKICKGECVTFTDASTATSTTITIWDWTFPGGTPGTAQGKGPHTVCYNGNNGNYNVELYVSDATSTYTSRLTETAYINVDPSNCNKDVNAKFYPSNMYGSSPQICIDSCIVFRDTSTGNPTSWVWTFIGGTPSSYNGKNPPPVCYDTEGKFPVSLYAENTLTNGIFSDTVYVRKCIAPIAKFNISQNNFCPGTCIGFIDESLNDPTNYYWTFSGGTQTLTSGDKNPTNICYDTAGVFTVTLLVSNTKGFDIYSDSVRVVDTCVTLKMPNAFSPNGTNDLFDKNNTFGIPLKIIQAGIINSAHGSIYNRWGQLVYEMKDKKDRWNGKLKNSGPEQPVGVYVYYIEANMKDGTIVKLNGNVTLLR